MQQKKTFSIPMVGGSSLLIIFAVLCLTIFTLLALSTVRADIRLSEASAKAVTDYYTADLQAEIIFSKLRQGTLPEGVSENKDTYTYSCPISETQSLMVELQKEDTAWKVSRWQAVSITP